jgi:hypothetical protein
MVNCLKAGSGQQLCDYPPAADRQRPPLHIMNDGFGFEAETVKDGRQIVAGSDGVGQRFGGTMPPMRERSHRTFEKRCRECVTSLDLEGSKSARTYTSRAKPGQRSI